MASYGRQMPHHNQAQQRHPAHGAAGHGHRVASPGAAAPSGTFAPGTKIQVGSHRVIIQKYLSEGGFAHVYLVKLPSPVDGTDMAVLKRVAVPDKDSLRGMRTEVETMKRLKGHRPIVTYIDSHASEMRGGGYEVFLLMEYCNGGGLIDFMNTRLQHRLTEPEILNIFADIAEGVACMHYLKPALLHRDIKVENILITSRNGVKRFKLCDFGSASAPRAAPTTVVECRLMDEDVQKHTTLQYRSPEMVDVYRKQPIDEKSDIWALGVLLYKLCYYTTPFEDQGQLAILNASYKFPNHPVFSDKLKKLIASMLRESIQARPNVYQVLAEACSMQGRKVPIHDIYSGKQAPKSQPPQKSHSAKKPQVGATVSAPVEKKEQIPDIVPMRRGRPTPSPSPRPQSAAASSRKVTDGDPFAALDSKSAPKPDVDAFSSRFLKLDQFSILHDKGGKFNFDSQTGPAVSKAPKETSQRMPEKLSGSSYPASRQAAVSPVPSSKLQSGTLAANSSSSSPVPSAFPSKSPSAPPKAISMRPQSMQPVSSQNTTSRYVSTGTMTTDAPMERKPVAARKPIQSGAAGQLGRSSTVSTARPSSTLQKEPVIRPVSPETPTFDNVRGYSEYNAGRGRPVSTNFDSKLPSYPVASQRDPRPLSSLPEPSQTGESLTQLQERLVADATNTSRQAHRQQASPSPPTVQGGVLGTAIKKFEHMDITSGQPERKGSPLKNIVRDDLADPLSESEAPWLRRSISRSGEEDEQNPEDMTPEMRREMERLQLEEEEKRVAAAQAEYRERVSAASQKPKLVPGAKNAGGAPGGGRIQSRVQAYLNDEQREPAVKRTAEGYGKYSDAATAASKTVKEPPEIKRKPVLAGVARANSMPQVRQPEAMSGATSTAQSKAPAKPPAPKKPVHLNRTTASGQAASPVKGPQDQEQLVAVDVPGQPALEWSSKDKDDYLDDFSKRFPSLSAIEGGGQ